MASLALAVVQSDPDTDLGGALAALPGARRVVLRPPELSGPPPTGAEIVTGAWARRSEAAALVRRKLAADTVVVLEAEETVSPELAAALAAAGAAGRPGAFRARRVVRFLGREIAGGTVVLAWNGEADAAPPQQLPGVLIARVPDVATLVARLDAQAAWLAAARTRCDLRDFVTRPLAALAGRLVARRRDGVPGLVLSVLETYGEVLTAAKVWERTRARSLGWRALRRGAVPVGFAPIATPTGYLVVRAGVGERLLRVLRDATPESVEGEPLGRGGRGATWAVAMGGGARAVLRWYRRGGALRRLLRDRYFGRRPRPLAELVVTEEARRRGVAAAEILAARVDRLGAGFYRGAIVTREVADAETLAEALPRAEPGRGRAAILEAVARTLRLMHDRGVHHRDLNASNILVRRDGDAVEACLIDFDRAQLRRAVPEWLRRRALRRLARSLAKLDVPGATLSAEDRAALARAYREAV